MPVTYLELENFKSYAGFQRIGPFDDFTCVIGPNGSGKSNCMDAISFVLGVQSRDLRSSQMRDLIFRPPGMEKSASTGLRASATLVYVDPLNDNKEIRFSRAISSQGVGEYLVNSEVVTYKVYEERLADIGVLVKARNFLVFQGDVESIARKSPKQLVQLFENISTSGELREEYEQALKRKDEAEAATMHAHNKRKGYTSERRLLKDQKEEADRFHTMLERRATMQTEFFLWQLFHLNESIVDKEEKTNTLREELKEVEAAVEEKAGALKIAKKNASSARRETSAADKTRIAVNSELDKLQPLTIKLNEEIKNLSRQVASDQKNVVKVEKQSEEHGNTLKELEKEISDYSETESQLQQEYEDLKRSGPGNVVLTEEEEAEYEEIRNKVAVASTKPRQTLNRLNRKLESARAKAANILEEVKEVTARKQEAEESVSALTERQSTLQNSIEKTKNDLKNSEQQLQSMREKTRQMEAKRYEIDSELEKINHTLREAKDQKKKSKDETRLLEAIATLKRHFPEVQGRLVDLCRPTQRRFNLAVTVAGGKDMDAIVVDTKQTGFDCIAWLRNNQIGTATFLPLDSLQVPNPASTERIRGMIESDGRYRLAADVISCDESVKRAVMYAVGNTVISDDLNSARQLCFGEKMRDRGQEGRIKAVTVGGAVISKAGTMTGGITRDDSSRAGRFDDGELEKLKKRKEKLESERLNLDSLEDEKGSVRHSRGGNASKIEEMQNSVGNLKNRCSYTQSDLDYTKSKLKEQKSLVQSTKKQILNLDKKTDAAEKEIRDLTLSVENSRIKVKEIEETHFNPFRAKTGLQDFTAYDEAAGKEREKYLKKRRTIREHLEKLKAKKEYEEGKDFSEMIEAAKKRLANHEDILASSREKEADLLDEVSDTKAKLADAESVLKQASETEKELENIVQETQKEYKEAQAEKLNMSKKINTSESALERLRAKLHETLQKARVEEAEIPLLADELKDQGDEDKDSEKDKDDSDSYESVERNIQLSQYATQESIVTTHFSQPDDSRVVKDKRDASRVDFSKLRSDLKQKLSEREEKRIRKDFEEQLIKLATQIENMNPNMKASEAYDNITERLKESHTDFEEAKKNARKKTAEFQAIRNKRSKRFNDAFSHIDRALKTIYTDMTKSSKHPLGGKAFLSLDDSEEPYRGGMKFNAMPPMKRFRDMEQLSGGEKTVAALSLLFAIHSFRPAPFFVMDEVDAALDNVNVLKVCNYIRQRSGDFQCIVISLKDMFYERSSRLVGICRDVATNSSRTLTLNLKQYGSVQDAGEKTEKSSAGRKRSRSTVADPPRSSRKARQ